MLRSSLWAGTSKVMGGVKRGFEEFKFQTGKAVTVDRVFENGCNQQN
jgi:hypothetical protein